QEKSLAFEKALSMDLIITALERCQFEFRERLYGPWVTVWAFVDQMLRGNCSCSEVLAQVVAYPPDSETQAGTRYPLVRAVVLFNLCMGVVSNFVFGPYQGKGSGESSLFRQLFDCLSPGDVVLGDKHYCSYRDICQLFERAVHTVVHHFSYRTQLAHNTIRIHMAQAAECLKLPLTEISFKNTMSILDAFRQLTATPEQIAIKIASIAHKRVGNRPGRSEPRAIKCKAKPYESLKTPRPTFANPATA
ncbi:MAG: hypothetical protein ACKPEY_13110, partial [Planctomycetota bacterium]